MSTPHRNHSPAPATMAQTLSRLLLGAFLLIIGTSHLTWARAEFQRVVPSWLPLPVDLVVVVSGLIEIALGGALIALSRARTIVGWVVAAFFVVIFPANILQYTNRIDAFGMNSDGLRAFRLLFQPVLVAWALWATGAWPPAPRRGDPRQPD